LNERRSKLACDVLSFFNSELAGSPKVTESFLSLLLFFHLAFPLSHKHNNLMPKSKKKTKKILRRIKPGAIFISLGILLLMAGSGFIGYQFHVWRVNQQQMVVDDRKSRIEQIYNSLKLGDEYIVQSSDIFGDKRVYSYDPGRTYSSSVTFVRNADVDVAVGELQKAIEAAGFVYFEHPYAGSNFTELHFKSAKGEYVRLNVQGKSRLDAIQNERIKNGPTVQMSDAVLDMDANAAPSLVQIKVNLDDNNE
jgi:hypothetical protein